MGKPEGYPFLAIAKRYGYPYAEVLAIADAFKSGRAPNLPDVWRDRAIAIKAIYDAGLIQQAIRDGKIDWQTGEPIDHDFWDGPDKDYTQRSHAPEDEPLVNW